MGYYANTASCNEIATVMILTYRSRFSPVNMEGCHLSAVAEITVASLDIPPSGPFYKSFIRSHTSHKSQNLFHHTLKDKTSKEIVITDDNFPK